MLISVYYVKVTVAYTMLLYCKSHVKTGVSVKGNVLQDAISLFSVADATITPHTLNFVKKLVSTFGVGIENVSSVSTTFSSAASESLARRAQATAQDPVFQKMKSQFTTDFDFK